MEKHLKQKGSSASTRTRTRSRSGSRTREFHSIRRPSMHRTTSSGSIKSLTSDLGNDSLDGSFNGEQDIEVPFVKAVLDHTLPTEYLKQDVIALLQSLRISKWHRLVPTENVIKELKLTRISGALTNSIYKVTYKHYYPLLLRIYGPNVESLIDRDTELKILFKLAKNNIGAKLLGCFTNGRFEEFLNHSVTLVKEQLREPKISRMIARRMKELHTGVQLDKYEVTRGPTCWYMIEKWLGIVENLLEGVDVQVQKSIFMVDIKTFRAHYEKYKKWVDGIYNGGLSYPPELVFCHNDTQYGNLLFYNPLESELSELTISDTTASSPVETPKLYDSGRNISTQSIHSLTKDSTKMDKKLVVIDFEYAAANVPAYDISNHFCEWMTDYHNPTAPHSLEVKRYPTRDEKLNLIATYVNYNGIEKNKRKNSFVEVSQENIKEVESKIKKLYNQCIYWRAASSVFWALWGVVQSGEDFKKYKSTQSTPTELDKSITKTTGIGPNGELYEITIDNEHDVGDGTVIEEAPESNDDFDYLQYTYQKVAMAYGDWIQLGLVGQSVLDAEHQKNVKFLSCELLE
ncbi:hypothetical protein LJB42_002016 [Komagataella kurtzmanii]|nr:hypothetical protein LJB42_002016 [Komagataella kurtzmanii]